MSRFCWCVGAWLLAMMLGCGSGHRPAYPVSGRVVFSDGDHVQLGTVEFREESTGTVARGKIEPNGTFQLTTFRKGDGAIEGSHKVIVQQLIISEDLRFADHDHGRRVPRKYAAYTTTDLKVDVQPIEKNEVVLTLAPASAPSGS